MTEQEMFIKVYAAIIGGYAGRGGPVLSLEPKEKQEIMDFAKAAATHAVESSREFTPPERKISDLPSTIPTYVHTFVHAHSNWVAVDPVDGNVFEFIDEPQLDEKGEHYMSPFGGTRIGLAMQPLHGLKQKRQR
jgi:hypothetical protein